MGTWFEEYFAAVHLARKLFTQRNAEYGNAIVYGGAVGAAIEFIGIAARLRQVILTPEGQALAPEVRRKILEDKFLDAINYGVIGLMLLGVGNETGLPFPEESLPVSDRARPDDAT